MDTQEEMLGKVTDGDFAVLVMDPDSTRIMSAACRVSEILTYRIACTPVELLCFVMISHY